MLDLAHFTALRALHARLGEGGVRWALTGSAGFALQGVPASVHDLDVQTDTAGAYEIARRFAECVVESVRFWDSGTMRSHFGVLTVADVRVEVMGDIVKCHPDGSWDAPPDLTAIIRWVEIAGMRIPVLALEYECQAYRTMGRIEKADLLRRWLAAREDEPE
jgi:hypothetical protein